MTINQLSVFVENRQGALSQITDLLAERGIDIRAMCLAETQNFGVLRLIVDNTDNAAAAFTENNIVFHITKVVAVAVSDTPGGLAKILHILSDNQIDIMYMYAFIAVSGNFATVVLRISSTVRDSAVNLLTDAGVRILGENDIEKL
jgi:hypothetical protein